MHKAEVVPLQEVSVWSLDMVDMTAYTHVFISVHQMVANHAASLNGS